MTIAIRTTNHGQKGGTLISVIGVILIVGVLGVSAISLIQSSEHSSFSANAGSRAYYLAESGLRYAQQRYCDEGWPHGREKTLSLLGGGDVKIIRIADTFWATAETGLGTAQEARDRILMPLSLCGEAPNAAGQFAIQGDQIGISLGSNPMIDGDVSVLNGDIEIRGDVVGSVFANAITLTEGSTVTGGIYSSGLDGVGITSGTVTGDIQSAFGISVTDTVKGWLFSEGDIDIGGGATVLGHIHACGADVTIGGNGAIIGTLDEPVEIRASGSVYLSGSAVVTGVVYAGGTIQMSGSAIIDGDAYAGGAISIGNNNSITGASLQNATTYLEEPICPDLENSDEAELPDPTMFTAGGTDINVPLGDITSPTEFILAPGIWGTLTSPDNITSPEYPDGFTHLYLNAGSADHGNYYFDSVSFGSKTRLYLDLSGTYDIRIFVVGDVAVGENLNMFVSTDLGVTYLPVTDALVDELLAARVYWETSADYNLGASSNWFGSVYQTSGSGPPPDRLRVGNASTLVGAYYAVGELEIFTSLLTYVAPNYFIDP